jgi:hypothetical protein
MTKGQLIESILIELGGGSASADVRERYRSGVIKLHAGVAFDDLIVRVFQNSENPSLSNLDAYCKFFGNVTLRTSDETGRIYVEIPTIVKKLLQIPHNKAIRRMMTVESVPRKCLYRDHGMSDVYNQLEVNTYLNQPRWDIIGSRIYFNSMIGNAFAVDILMLVPFSEWSDTEDLPAPLENNPIISEYVVGKMRNMPPEDKIIDDNLQQN